MLDGYKTYIAIMTGGIVVLLQYYGVIPKEVADALKEIVAGAIFIFIRMALAKNTAVTNTTLAAQVGAVAPQDALAISIANPAPLTSAR